jgi:hypothetical protein
MTNIYLELQLIIKFNIIHEDINIFFAIPNENLCDRGARNSQIFSIRNVEQTNLYYREISVSTGK